MAKLHLNHVKDYIETAVNKNTAVYLPNLLNYMADYAEGTNEEEIDEFKNAIIELENNKQKLITDSIHTFDELYEFRRAYNFAYFNEMAKKYTKPEMTIHTEAFADLAIDLFFHHKEKIIVIPYKTKNHHPEDSPIYEGYFLVGAIVFINVDNFSKMKTISNHYKLQDWNLARLVELPHSLKFDGHTSEDVLTILNLINQHG